jgi:hypothetical protein
MGLREKEEKEGGVKKGFRLVGWGARQLHFMEAGVFEPVLGK